MRLTSFEYSKLKFAEWCEEQQEIKLIKDLAEQSTELETILDQFGIDALIEYKGQKKTVQYRVRRPNKVGYGDVTVRRFAISQNENRAYKIRNVALFIYITPEWWVILDTVFYDKVTPYDTNENWDGSDFYCYRIHDLIPYVVWSNKFAKAGDENDKKEETNTRV